MSAATQPPEGVDSFLPLRDAVTQPDALSDSMNAPLGGAAARRRPFGISLFWRTFLLLSLLAMVCPSAPTFSATSWARAA